MNLFWSTRKLTNAYEDHLTEFMAAALAMSAECCKGYCEIVLGDFAEKKGWTIPNVESIQTQPAFDENNCRPDMLLQLAGGKRVICEHKIESMETHGPKSDEPDQLMRYLDLPIDGVVYVRSSWNPPSNGVLNHPKYIRPKNREHFLWQDFYHLFDNKSNLFLKWLKEGFEKLGLTPPHPSVGELNGPNPEENRKNRQNFAKFWSSTRTFAYNLGWRVEAASIAELFMTNSPSALATIVYVSPTKSTRFLIRVTPRRGKLNAAFERLQVASDDQSVPNELNKNVVTREQGKITVVDITTSLLEILGKAPLTSQEIEKKLFSYVTHFLKAIQ